MKKKETLIRFCKVFIFTINLLFVLVLSYYIISSSFESNPLINSNFRMKINFQTIENFYTIIKNYTEFKLMKIFGEELGRFLFLCLSSWVLSVIVSLFVIRKVHQSKIIKVGAI
jgi:hypothetical protein